MPDLSPLQGVALRGIASALPLNRQSTLDCTAFRTREDAERFASATGIRERRLAVTGQCASDLCAAAADALLKQLGWPKESIGMLVMVTQSPDFLLPATAILLQHRLGLSTTCIAFDINLGCSAFPFGLAQMSSTLSAMGIRRGLLLIGDVSSRGCNPADASSYPLFGDAGAAIALELDAEAEPMYFDLRSDGSGGAAICVKESGLAGRHPVNAESLIPKACGNDGFPRSGFNTRLRGADIFSFSISQAPASIRRVMESAKLDPARIDHLVLHQANRMINDSVRRKVGFEASQSPVSLERYGNTGAASIPVTLCVSSGELTMPGRVLACGFGVGLSWGSVIFRLEVHTPLLLLETDEVFRPDLLMDPDGEP